MYAMLLNYGHKLGVGGTKKSKNSQVLLHSASTISISVSDLGLAGKILHLRWEKDKDFVSPASLL